MEKVIIGAQAISERNLFVISSVNMLEDGTTPEFSLSCYHLMVWEGSAGRMRRYQPSVLDH